MSKKTNNADAANKVNAAAVVANENANNANNNANAAADNTPTPEKDAEKPTPTEHAKMSPTDVMSAAVALIKDAGTISNIRARYAEHVNTYGKENFAAVLNACKELRAREIDAAADDVNKSVFTFTGISAAVFRAVAACPGYDALCTYARRTYAGTDAERAAAVIKDYYNAVDVNGAPLCRVSYINAAGTEIYAAFALKTLTHTNAVAVLKSAFDGMKAAALKSALKKDGNDNAAATRANVRNVGAIVAVYAAAKDAAGRVTLGERRDTSADVRTRDAAAALIGNTLPVGVVPVATWNAALNGNESAADAVAAAAAAAKDAATERAAAVAK